MRGNVNYFFVADTTGSGEFGNREEIAFSLTARLSKYWTADANIREDLTDGGGTISEGIGLRYQDECFILNFKVERSFTEDRDLKPKDTLFFQLIFKHLGGFKGRG